MRRVRRLLVLVLSVLALATVGAAPASAAGDDYPWRTDTSWTSDWYGFTKRQCTSFVAWRIDQRGTAIKNSTQGWGGARNWDDTAARLGIPRSTRPVVGAVAQWNSYETSPYYSSGSTYANGTMKAGSTGHVAFVQAVYADGSALVSHYNMSGARTYSTMRVKAPRYLYVPR